MVKDAQGVGGAHRAAFPRYLPKFLAQPRMLLLPLPPLPRAHAARSAPPPPPTCQTSGGGGGVGGGLSSILS